MTCNLCDGPVVPWGGGAGRCRNCGMTYTLLQPAPFELTEDEERELDLQQKWEDEHDWYYDNMIYEE